MHTHCAAACDARWRRVYTDARPWKSKTACNNIRTPEALWHNSGTILARNHHESSVLLPSKTHTQLSSHTFQGLCMTHACTHTLSAQAFQAAATTSSVSARPAHCCSCLAVSYTGAAFKSGPRQEQQQDPLTDTCRTKRYCVAKQNSCFSKSHTVSLTQHCMAMRRTAGPSCAEATDWDPAASLTSTLTSVQTRG